MDEERSISLSSKFCTHAEESSLTQSAEPIVHGRCSRPTAWLPLSEHGNQSQSPAERGGAVLTDTHEAQHYLHPKQRPNKLWITHNDALSCAHLVVGGVWLRIILGYMGHPRLLVAAGCYGRVQPLGCWVNP